MESPPVVRRYQLRLTSRHAEDNGVDALDFALRRPGEDWQPHAPSLQTSPFLDFLHAAFLCQLAFLRMNATERAVGLHRVHGLCECDTEDFRLTRFDVTFAMELRHGAPSAADLAFFAERCLACPVSRNLPHVSAKQTRVHVANGIDIPDLV